jgi:protoporphyrinogen IX oxidase
MGLQVLAVAGDTAHMSFEALKTIHLIFLVAWFAGLFYIFRLFVYHVKHKDSRDIRALLPVMESKLLHIIMGPAALITMVSGIAIVVLHRPDYWNQSWLHLKLLMVLVLVGYHGFSEVVAARFKRGDFFLSEKQCRWINELPTLLLMIVVILVIYRPWVA